MNTEDINEIVDRRTDSVFDCYDHRTPNPMLRLAVENAVRGAMMDFMVMEHARDWQVLEMLTPTPITATEAMKPLLDQVRQVRGLAAEAHDRAVADHNETRANT